MIDRDAHAWYGVYDDDRFDRYVRTSLRKMTRTNAGFENTTHYQ